jgi:hypothetical protein
MRLRTGNGQPTPWEYVRGWAATGRGAPNSAADGKLPELCGVNGAQGLRFQFTMVLASGVWDYLDARVATGGFSSDRRTIRPANIAAGQDACPGIRPQSHGWSGVGRMATVAWIGRTRLLKGAASWRLVAGFRFFRPPLCCMMNLPTGLDLRASQRGARHSLLFG